MQKLPEIQKQLDEINDVAGRIGRLLAAYLSEDHSIITNLDYEYEDIKKKIADSKLKQDVALIESFVGV